MCLGVPGQIVQTDDNDFMRMGAVDFGGVTRNVCLAYTPEAQVGDYVVVHAGFAISQIDQAEAQEILKLMMEVGILEEEPEEQVLVQVPSYHNSS